MKNNRVLKIQLFLLLFLEAFTAFAQTSATHPINFTLPEIALVDVEPEMQAITLSLINVNEAGAPINAVTDNSKWVNYTSAVPQFTNRSITAQLSGGTLPNGVVLTLTAANPSGSGSGTLGASAGTVTLSNTPVVIINGIGGAYTGNGVNNGHQLTYTLKITDLQNLTIGTTSLSVIFTLTDAM